MKHNSNFSPSKSVKSMRKSRPIPHKEEIVMKSDSSESELEYVVEEFNTSESEPFEIKVSKPEEDKLSEVLVNTISKRHSIYNNLDNFLTENAKESEEFKKEKMIQSLLQDCKFKPSKNIFNIPRTNRNRINQCVTPNCLNTSKSKDKFGRISNISCQPNQINTRNETRSRSKGKLSISKSRKSACNTKSTIDLDHGQSNLNNYNLKDLK